MTYDVGEQITFTDPKAFQNFIEFYFGDYDVDDVLLDGIKQIHEDGGVHIKAIETDKHRIPNSDNIFPPIPKDI